MTETSAMPSTREALRLMVSLLRLMRPYWKPLARQSALTVALGFVGLLVPYLTKLYFDQVYPTRDVELLHVLVITMLVVSFVNTLMNSLASYYSQLIDGEMWGAASLTFFNHLQHLPARFFEEQRVGEVLSRFGDLRAALSGALSMMHTLFGSGVYLVVVPPFLLIMNWRLALLSLAVIPLTTVLSTIGSRAARGLWKRSAEASSELSALQFETLSQIRLLKTLNAERQTYHHAESATRRALHAQSAAMGVSAGVGAATALLSTAGTSVFTWFAWSAILRNEMTLGDFIVFSSYLGYLTGPVSQIAGLISGFQHDAVTLARAFEYLEHEVEQDPTASVVSDPTLTFREAELTLDDVSFAYAPDRRILDRVSLRLRPGTVTAVVGASGAGKSTLLKVLCRLEEPSSGQLSLNGVPSVMIPVAEYRSAIGTVLQDSALLRGTLFENLTYGLSADIPDLQLRVAHAVSVCQLEGLVAELPDGLSTPVAEWGASVSGGQRQRLAIARAIIRRQPVLLLDEATSQVDVATESKLLHALFADRREKTILFVTHRVATAALADQVCVMDKGRVVAVGTHAALLDDCEVYRNLVRSAAMTAEGEREPESACERSFKPSPALVR